MKRRKWDAKAKAIIVLEGLKGKPAATICQDYQIRQAQYYQWRDQFLANAPKTLRSRSRRNVKPASSMRMLGSKSWWVNSPSSLKKRQGLVSPTGTASRDTQRFTFPIEVQVFVA